MHQVGQIKQVRRFAVGALLAVLAGTSFVSACGGDDDLQRVEVAELTVEGAESGQIDLELPPRDDINQEQAPPITIRNSGLATLKVTRLELVNAPSRLQAWSASDAFCSEGCGAEQACLNTTCVDLGLPETPFDIRPGLREDIDFLLLEGSSELDCPEAPATIAPEFADFYCGELIIETNAINNSGIVENGKARVLFLRPNSSGQLVVTPDPLVFDGVQAGSTQSVDFSIQNAGSQILTVNSIGVESRANFFSVTGPRSLPTELNPNDSGTWTLTLDIPAGTDPSEFVGGTQLLIDSSASSGGRIPIIVSTEAASAPKIELSSQTLKFDAQASQTLTISNTGDATLIINRLKVDPLEARDFYTFSIDGQDVTATLPQQNIPKGDSIDVDVTFTRPGGNANSSVGILTIGHNVQAQNLSSEVTLLGDAGDVPIARVYPQGFTFLAEDGNTETRTFVMRNIGTATLDVSAAMLMFSTGSDAEFQVSGVPANIPPSGIATGTVTFSGANASTDVGNVVLTTNDDTGSLLLGIKDVTSAGSEIIPSVTPLFQNDARVGTELGFTAANSAPADAASTGIWMLVDRPASSESFFFSTGEELRFVPDVAGAYKIGLILAKDQREAQVVYDLTVVD